MAQGSASARLIQSSQVWTPSPINPGMWRWWMWAIKLPALTCGEQHGEPWENVSAPGKCQRGPGVKRGWWRERKKGQRDQRCGEGDWEEWVDWEHNSLRRQCNRIYWDITMIQLSSCAFKPMLHGVPRIGQLHFRRVEDILNICPDGRFIFYFRTPPNFGDNKLQGYIIFAMSVFVVQLILCASLFIVLFYTYVVFDVWPRWI